jgi:hypothetical protein
MASEIAKAARGLVARRLLRHPARHQVAHRHLEVETKLVVDLGVETGGGAFESKEALETRNGHGTHPGAASTRF